MFGCSYVTCRFFADPHIKVAGMKEAVAAAKEKILTVLDTKVCFVLFTLCCAGRGDSEQHRTHLARLYHRREHVTRFARSKHLRERRCQLIRGARRWRSPVVNANRFPHEQTYGEEDL